MKKNVLNYIGVLILIVIATYLGASFYSGSFNITLWSENARHTAPVIMIIAAFFFSPMLED